MIKAEKRIASVLAVAERGLYTGGATTQVGQMDKAPPSQKKEWELTEEAFQGLLDHLSSDRDEAAESYERTRRKLIIFFEFRGCLTPEELTDETINRVARRIQEGQSIHTGNIGSYFYGVARNVMHEYWKETDRKSESIRALARVSEIEAPDEVNSHNTQRMAQERRLQCLERCLAGLPAEARRVIFLYYRDEKGAQIETRRKLAQELDIADYALRLRVSRIRAKLDSCIHECLNR
jgi:RNA polymerase sigma factor (sigma-70 family)